ncbi:AAA family ATPase [Devosia marina]|uniref:AAA family ATPase n=1 Tax=Devosia marina TaxID=2683198 RepID=A0A7X3K334_9HYPH|nr:AAA family ATPase [Devosia marina]MVS98871.1 AAA family ATPase [Devosia marina]
MADNDEELDDMSMEELNALEEAIIQRDDDRRSATHTIPELMVQKGLSPAQAKVLRRDYRICVVIQAPSSDWVAPLARACRRMGEWRYIHSVNEAPRRTISQDTITDQLTTYLSDGHRILAISHNLDYLPTSIVASADIVLKLGPPDDHIVREAIKAATRRTPRDMPDGIAQGLNYGEICGAIRTGSSAKRCVERLVAARNAVSKPASGLSDVPALENLHGYGKAMDWAQALITDLDAWRAGKLDFSAIERTVVLASEPGLGKTTFARSLAKSAGVPFFPTSVSQWFSNSPGYLDSIIKQIDELFATAAAVAPACIFLDEIESLPSRSSNDRHSSWWTPVVGHMLLKLDSAASGVSSKLIIIGATNHPEKLDAALVRPGRLSKIIRIETPDAKALAGIVRQHLGPDLPNADLTMLAKMAVGASGADVHDWVKAARRVARQAHRPIALADVMDQVLPPESRPPEFVRRVAVHEAGHAVVSHILKPGSVNAIHTVGRNASEGGRTSTSWDAGGLWLRAEIENAATVFLAGRCSEQVLLGSASGGSGGGVYSDLARASHMLAMVHGSLGLGEDLLHRATSETIGAVLSLDVRLAKAVEADLQRLNKKAMGIVQDSFVMINAVADALVEHRHLTGEQFAAICDQVRGRATKKLMGGNHG